MNILYLGYWSAREGLSTATIKPHLQVLSTFPQVSGFYYISMERDQPVPVCSWDIAKFNHIPYPTKTSVWRKIWELFHFTSFVVKICREKKIDKIIARSSPAGIYAYLAHIETGIPFFVESFEPHADYMNAIGVWKSWDPRYWLQAYFEKKIKQNANGLLPVSNAYKQELRQGPRINCPIVTLPCTVDLEKFTINKPLGQATRQHLGFAPDDWVGIYVGKFGDIYFDSQAYMWFGQMKKYLPQFKLIILTGQDKEEIAGKLINAGFAAKDFFIGLVPHNEVPAYLNAADFAFCLHRPHAYSHAYSPIKNGEYWACGLPVIIPENIGDDSDILKKTNLGVVVNGNLLTREHINKLTDIAAAKEEQKIRGLAKKLRESDKIKMSYQFIFSNEPEHNHS